MKCFTEVRLECGSVRAGALAYHRVGKALRRLLSFKHGNKYGKNLVALFVEEWTRRGGFPFGLGQAKYFRVFAHAFDEQLLQKAINARVGWTVLRELSGPGVSAKLRRDIVDRVSHILLKPEDALGYLLNHPDYNPGIRSSPAQIKSIFNELIRRIEALGISLGQLDTAKRPLLDSKKSFRKKVVKVCTEIINLPVTAEQCNTTLASVVKTARKQRKTAQLGA